MTYPLLGRIQAPGDVKRLQESELPALCEHSKYQSEHMDSS